MRTKYNNVPERDYEIIANSGEERTATQRIIRLRGTPRSQGDRLITAEDRIEGLDRYVDDSGDMFLNMLRLMNARIKTLEGAATA